LSGHLLLVGMMGSGKSTVASLLGERMGRPVFDSDAEVERATGRSVVEIFAAEGEGAFREQERLALGRALAEREPAVIAVAGGAVLDPRNRAAMRRGGTVVWLRAELATLAERVGDGGGRPLLAGDAAAALARLSAERAPLYAEVADVTVDVDGVRAGEVADSVLKAVAALPRAPR
jgi:shikimate kinase